MDPVTPNLLDANGAPMANTGAPTVTKGESAWPSSYSWIVTPGAPATNFTFQGVSGSPEVPIYRAIGLWNKARPSH